MRMNRYYLSGAIGLTVCMLAAFLLLAWNLETRAKNITLVRESGMRRATIGRLMRLMVDAETAQRGFLLTTDPKYLEPYEAARKEVSLVLDEIGNAYVREGSPPLSDGARQELRKLRELSAARMNEIAASLALYASNDPQAALALIRTNLGKDSMDDLRFVVAELERREADLTAIEVKQWESGVLIARLMILGGTVLNIALVIGAVVLVNRDLRRREEQAAHLERYSEELEQQVQRRTSALSELSSHLQNVAEREKAAIARELHDELGGLMIAAKMDVAWLERHLAIPDEAIKLRWTRLQKLLEDGLNMKRRVVETLRPTLLDNMGLIPAVKWIYQETCARGGLKCSERYPVDELHLRSDAAIAVFRIVQEALTNIVKHAKAAEVDLAMWIERRALKIEIRDNGVGMPAGIPKSGRQGLSSMRHRVTSLGGTWQIFAPQGGGTGIRITLPLAGILEPAPALSRVAPTESDGEIATGRS